MRAAEADRKPFNRGSGGGTTWVSFRYADDMAAWVQAHYMLDESGRWTITPFEVKSVARSARTNQGGSMDNAKFGIDYSAHPGGRRYYTVYLDTDRISE